MNAMMPVLFINHGAPPLAMVESDYTRFLAETGKRLRPKAIVIFSAHWEEKITTISFAEDALETIYDFYGFPQELYQLTYPASGSPEIAEKLEQMFHKSNIETQRDNKRGLDHGSWIFLRFMYPEATIPIVTISVNPFLPAEEQYKIGEALRGLGQEDILVIGSGTTVHNLREINFGQKQPEPWAMEFDNWLIDKLQKKDIASLLQYDKLAPHAARAVPRAEHFVPLFQALGSADPSEIPKLIYRGYDYGSFSYTSFEFGNKG
jgi:4,5-DOPA dioxygenase extradiol